MSRFWNPAIKSLSPYVPGEQPRIPDLLKLNTNELPLGPSPRVLEALRDSCDESLRLYPDPDNAGLRAVYAELYGLDENQVFLGNGSDEVLAHSFKALFQPGSPVLFPDITYSFYPVYSRFFELNWEVIAVDENYCIQLADYQRPNGGIIFPNPNAPTGIFTPLQAVCELLDANPDSVVIVDEAYVDFGGESAVRLIERYPNLLVVQTLSKSRALAGLRVGAAFGQSHLIDGLQRVKNSFNSYPLDRLAEAGAIAALQDQAWFEASCAQLCATRESLALSLQKLGFRVLPSAANFLFVAHETRAALELYAGLRERGILVRHFQQPRIENFLRITIGTEGQSQRLLQALLELLD